MKLAGSGIHTRSANDLRRIGGERVTHAAQQEFSVLAAKRGDDITRLLAKRAHQPLPARVLDRAPAKPSGENKDQEHAGRVGKTKSAGLRFFAIAMLQAAGQLGVHSRKRRGIAVISSDWLGLIGGEVFEHFG